MSFQFFCQVGVKKLPSIVVTANSYQTAKEIADRIYADTIQHFNLESWFLDIEGYYVGRNCLDKSISARFSNS
jgi:hypothetical protein